MSHIIKCSIEDEMVVKIDYDTGNPSHPKPGKHVLVAPQAKLRWENDDPIGTLSIHFDDSPFESGLTDFTALPGKTTSLEQIIQPYPATGPNPVFPYTIRIGGISEDPDILIDLGSSRPRIRKKSPPKKKK
jgi:hypothetical protein